MLRTIAILSKRDGMLYSSISGLEKDDVETFGSRKRIGGRLLRRWLISASASGHFI